MKFLSLKPAFLTGVLFTAITLAGCAATQQDSQQRAAQGGTTAQDHQAHHPEGASSQPSVSPGQGTGGGQGGMMGQGGQMDMKSMCSMHERMKSARTPQERGAMMDQFMPNMTPEMRQRQMDMMERHCR